MILIPLWGYTRTYKCCKYDKFFLLNFNLIWQQRTHIGGKLYWFKYFEKAFSVVFAYWLKRIDSAFENCHIDVCVCLQFTHSHTHTLTNTHGVCMHTHLFNSKYLFPTNEILIFLYFSFSEISHYLPILVSNCIK